MTSVDRWETLTVFAVAAAVFTGLYLVVVLPATLTHGGLHTVNLMLGRADDGVVYEGMCTLVNVTGAPSTTWDVVNCACTGSGTDTPCSDRQSSRTPGPCRSGDSCCLVWVWLGLDFPVLVCADEGDERCEVRPFGRATLAVAARLDGETFDRKVAGEVAQFERGCSSRETDGSPAAARALADECAAAARQDLGENFECCARRDGSGGLDLGAGACGGTSRPRAIAFFVITGIVILAWASIATAASILGCLDCREAAAAADPPPRHSGRRY